MVAQSEHEVENTIHGSFETILYSLTSILLLGVIISPLFPIKLRDLFLYSFLSGFTLFIFVYSFYTVRTVTIINESQGKSTFIGVSMFYTGFIAVLWSVLARIIQYTFSKPTESIQVTIFEYLLLPIQNPSLLYAGLGISVFGILLEITNLDEILFMKLIQVFTLFLKNIYKILADTSILGALVVFVVGVQNAPRQWPYSSFWFAAISSYIYLMIFNRNLNAKLFNFFKRNYKGLFNILGIFFFIRSLFITTIEVRNIYFGLSAVSFLIAYNYSIRSGVKKVWYFLQGMLREKPLQLVSIFGFSAGIVIGVLGYLNGFPIYIGLGILVVSALLDLHVYFNALKSMYLYLQSQKIRPLLNLIGIPLVVLFLSLGAIFKHDGLLISGFTILIFLILINSRHLIHFIGVSLKSMFNSMFYLLKQMVFNFQKTFKILRVILTIGLNLFAFILITIPKAFGDYTPFVIVASLLSASLLSYQFYQKNLKTVSLVLGLTYSFFFYLDYLLTKNQFYLLTAGLSLLLVIIVNSSFLHQQLILFFRNIWHMIHSFLRAMYRLVLSLSHWIGTNVLLASYFILEVALLIYALIILVMGDPFHILVLNTFADRLSIGLGLLLLSLAAFILSIRKIFSMRKGRNGSMKRRNL